MLPCKGHQKQTPRGLSCWRQDTTWACRRSRFLGSSVQIPIQFRRCADRERPQRHRGQRAGAWPGWWPTPPTGPRWWWTRHGRAGGGGGRRASGSPSSTQLRRRPPRPGAGDRPRRRRRRPAHRPRRGRRPRSACTAAPRARSRFTDPALDDLRRARARLPRGAALVRIAVLDTDPAAGDDLARRSTPGSGCSARRTARWRVVYTRRRRRRHHPGGLGRRRAQRRRGLRRGARSACVSPTRPTRSSSPGSSERLGRITGTVPVPRNRIVEPVPDWLADALIERTALTRLDSRRHGRHHRLRRLERPRPADPSASPFGHGSAYGGSDAKRTADRGADGVLIALSTPCGH